MGARKEYACAPPTLVRLMDQDLQVTVNFAGGRTSQFLQGSEGRMRERGCGGKGALGMQLRKGLLNSGPFCPCYIPGGGHYGGESSGVRVVSAQALGQLPPARRGSFEGDFRHLAQHGQVYPGATGKGSEGRTGRWRGSG